MTAPRLDIGRWTDDDDLIDAAAAGRRTLVRVARPGGVTVVIGSGSRPELELDSGACARDGVPVLRRRGGGCAVVLDPGNLVVSVARPLEGLGGVRTHFEIASAWISAALADLGVPGLARRGTSDLALGERKVGGSCIFRRKDLIYYSTTLLVDARIELIERYLVHPPREPDYRAGRPHREFLVRLADVAPSLAAAPLAVSLRERLTAASFDAAVRGA